MSEDREGENRSAVTQDRGLAGNTCLGETTPPCRSWGSKKLAQDHTASDC